VPYGSEEVKGVVLRRSLCVLPVDRSVTDAETALRFGGPPRPGNDRPYLGSGHGAPALAALSGRAWVLVGADGWRRKHRRQEEPVSCAACPAEGLMMCDSCVALASASLTTDRIVDVHHAAGTTPRLVGEVTLCLANSYVGSPDSSNSRWPL